MFIPPSPRFGLLPLPHLLLLRQALALIFPHRDDHVRDQDDVGHYRRHGAREGGGACGLLTGRD